MLLSFGTSYTTKTSCLAFIADFRIGKSTLRLAPSLSTGITTDNFILLFACFFVIVFINFLLFSRETRHPSSQMRGLLAPFGRSVGFLRMQIFWMRLLHPNHQSKTDGIFAFNA